MTRSVQKKMAAPCRRTVQPIKKPAGWRASNKATQLNSCFVLGPLSPRRWYSNVGKGGWSDLISELILPLRDSAGLVNQVTSPGFPHYAPRIRADGAPLAFSIQLCQEYSTAPRGRKIAHSDPMPVLGSALPPALA